MAKSDENSRQKKHSRTLHCPRCDSTNIYIPIGGYTGNYYHCKDCGYEGALVIEYECEDEDFSRKNPDNNNNNNNNISPEVPGESRSLAAGFIVFLILVALFLMIIILGIAGVF